MPAPSSSRCLRWLRGELPRLIENGAISTENARAIERYYEASAIASRNFGFVLLASVGSTLVGAGIILLVAHNWDEFSRPLRTAIAFLPLLAAQVLSLFILLRRADSRPWREAAAVFQIAAIGAAISLVSQTYQITGTISQFILVWMLLSAPLIYLLWATAGALLYLAGAVYWLFRNDVYLQHNSPLPFWLLLFLVLPYCAMIYRRERESRALTTLAIAFATAVAIGLGYTAEFSHAHIFAFAFAGFLSATYICGMEFLPAREPDRLHPLALLAGIAIGVTAIVLTFEETWNLSRSAYFTEGAAQITALIIQLLFPLAAILLAIRAFIRGKIRFSILAVAFPIAAGIGALVVRFCLPEEITWSRSCASAAAILFDLYALALGVELIARGLRADSITRANFGLLVIAALAVARFFDSDLSFLVRALGFIVIGLGFLFTNMLLLKKRRA